MEIFIWVSNGLKEKGNNNYVVKIKGGNRGIITKKGVVHMNQKILMWIALALILLQGKLEFMWM